MTSSKASGPAAVSCIAVTRIAVLLAAALSTGCGEESFEATNCAELPQYNIRQANPDHQDDVGGLPDDKRSTDAKKAEDDGCITLPKFRPTLTDEQRAEARERNK